VNARYPASHTGSNACNRREGAPTGFGVHSLLLWEARPRGDAFDARYPASHTGSNACNRREGAPPTGFGAHSLLLWEARPRGDAFGIAGWMKPTRPLCVGRLAMTRGDREARANA